MWEALQKRLGDALARSDGHQASFVSGVFLALAGNVLVYALAPTEHPRNYGRLVVAGVLLIGGSLAAALAGGTLQRFEVLAREERVTGPFTPFGEAKHRLVVAALPRLCLLLAASVGLTVAAGLTLLS